MRKFLITGTVVFFLGAMMSIVELSVLPQFQSFEKSGIYQSYQNMTDFQYSFSAKYSDDIFWVIFLIIAAVCFYGLMKSLSISYYEQLTMGLICAPLAILGLVGGLGFYSLYTYIAPWAPISEASRTILGVEGWNGLSIVVLAVLSGIVATIGSKLNANILRNNVTTITSEKQKEEDRNVLGISYGVALLVVLIIVYLYNI